MDRKTQIKQWIKGILERNLSGIPYRAFIFGSQANLTELRRADIDIGIMPDQPVDTHRVAQIQADIETLPMLYKIDLINFSEVDDNFKSIALRNIEWL